MKKFSKQLLFGETAIIIFLAAAKVAFHLLLPEYGFHRDELYYITIGDRFHFSNLDMLPLSPLYLRFFTFVFGYSIKTVHLASAILGAGSLILACMITKEFGGGKYAVLLTGIFIFFSAFIPFGSLYTYDSMDFFLIVLMLYLLVKIFRTDNQKLWLYVGLVLGLGLMNKLTILFWGLAIFVSLLIVPQRKIFKTKHVWLAGIIALLFLVPYLIFQSKNNWYFIGFASQYAGGISYIASFPEFLWNQILPNNIAALPVWLTGLYLLLFSPRWKTYRFFGIIYVFLFLFFYEIGVKFYFLVPMYAVLLSVGSIKLEEKIGRLKKTAIAVPVAFIILSVPMLPMLVPILPVNSLVNYAKTLGVDAGIKFENNRLNQLPQYFADRFGWKELVSEISEVYHSVPASEIGRTGMLTNNWGIASAIHFYKNEYNLPEPVSDAGWFYFEINKDADLKKTYVCVGLDEVSLHHLFKSVELKKIFTNQYCMPHENNRPIYLCENPKVELSSFIKIARNIDPTFLSVLKNDGIKKAIEYYRQQKAVNPNVILFTENQINSMGYEFLRKNSTEEAILLFQFNVEVFPESFNVYDSLGEAYMKAKQYDLAVTYYKKSLELNPANTNGKDKLEELRKLMSLNSK